MASPTVAVRPVAGPVFSIEDMEDRGIHASSRVGSCVRPHTFGVITLVVDENAVLIEWDDTSTEWVRWTAVAPLGYAVGV